MDPIFFFFFLAVLVIIVFGAISQIIEYRTDQKEKKNLEEKTQAKARRS